MKRFCFFSLSKTCYLTSLSLSFLICELRIILVTNSWVVIHERIHTNCLARCLKQGNPPSRNATVSVPSHLPPGGDHALNLSYPQEALICWIGLLFGTYGFLTIYVQSFFK